MAFLDDEHFDDTIIAGITDILGNRIIEIRDLILSSLHIGLRTGDAK